MPTDSGVRFSTRLVAAAAVAWGLLVWANWLAHNPLSARQVFVALAAFAKLQPGPALAAWGPHLGRLLLLGLLATAAAGLGVPVLGWLARRGGTSPGLLAAGLGSGVAALAVLGAGLAGLAFRGPAWICVGVAAVAGLRRLRLPRWGWALKAGCWPMTAALGVALFVALLGALAPEVSFDALAHHLAHPASWAAAHKVHGLPYHFLALYPAVLEMQYLLAILLDGVALAKLVHFGFGLLTIAALVAWARRTLPDAWALAAAAGFALLPYVQTVAMWAYVDLGASAYLTLALSEAAGRVEGRARDGGGNPALLGVLCGLCAGTKAAGVFAPVLVAGVLAGRRAPPRAWIAFAAAALMAAVPWGIRNWALTGNPFAPFLSGWVPTLWWDAGNQARYAKELGGYALGHAPVGGVIALLAHAWSSSVLNYGVLDQQSGMGAWFLWLIPLLALVGVAEARLPARLALGFFLLWFLIPRQVRYLLPVWPAAALASAHALRALAARSGTALIPVWGAGAMLVLAVAGAFQREHWVINPLPVVFGTESAEDYHARGLPGKLYTVRASAWLRDHAQERRVLVVSHYGLNLLWGPRAIAQAAFDTPVIERVAREASGPARIAVKFRELGVPWILYSTFGGFTMHAVYEMYGFDEGAAARWRAFWISRSVPVVNLDDRYQVWRIAAAPTGRTTASVLPGLDEQWLGATDWDLQYAEQTGRVAAALPKAEAEYRAIAAARRTPAAFERLGSVLMRRGRLGEAERALREAARLGRDTAVLHDALGVLCARDGRLAEAIREFRRSLAIEPGLVDPRRNLATVLWNMGDRNAAMGTLREGLALDPDSGELRDLLVRWTGGGAP
ncbi:MAG: tetratricopeptide repeat protein [Candidatus Coatesbacteria bacterium]